MPVLDAARARTAVPAALLCLAVSWIHVQDQGGFPGDKTPHYVGIGYYLLEVAGVVAAALLLTGARMVPERPAWLLAVGVGVGPLVGFVLSRGPGLPDYSDDKGNWTEPLGLVSLAVELGLVLLAALALRRTAAGAVAGRA
ncbi:hypothetical protein ACFW1A_34495 [Kitasatospora sp. NPDC058965]|uniref:hypothetical protein n=1 Tax=Kitasatospora sp. NPDC058965 TaxID=3346682 RepID=UPI0036CA0327